MYNVREDATLHRQNCYKYMYKILSDFFRYVIKKLVIRLNTTTVNNYTRSKQVTKLNNLHVHTIN